MRRIIFTIALLASTSVYAQQLTFPPTGLPSRPVRWWTLNQYGECSGIGGSPALAAGISHGTITEIDADTVKVDAAEFHSRIYARSKEACEKYRVHLLKLDENAKYN